MVRDYHQPGKEWGGLRALNSIFTSRGDEIPAKLYTGCGDHGDYDLESQNVDKEREERFLKCVQFLCCGDIQFRVYGDDFSWRWNSQDPREKRHLIVDLKLWEVQNEKHTFKGFAGLVNGREHGRACQGREKH
ncbi:unnamed protein product [Allacma fusca]|uniref:Uncharacterized protein n=1 Tax=Allacma fusca TaxID=39272 RepID=A0A8J2K0Q2_9HEXA|nr:unnamed protein product [Allacma fusca]